ALDIEGTQPRFVRRVVRPIGRDDSNKGRLITWDPGLATQRMALEHGDGQGVVEGIAPRQADAGPTLRVGYLHRSQIMKALSRALIDGVAFAALGFDHIAKGGKRYTCQYFQLQYAHDCVPCAASLPHTRSLLTPPSGMILSLTWVTGPRALMVDSS